jgi:hypothetical protein
MAEEENSKKEPFFEDVVKKTKTGVTFPKSFREEFFEEEEDIFFRMVVPKEKDKIILEILSEERVKELSAKLKKSRPSTPRAPREKKASGPKKKAGPVPLWSEYFVYEFDAIEKVKPILESAFYKFAETPPNLEDAMGRVKYALISFLSSTKTENARLYLSVEKFLLDVIEKFDQPNLLDWIFDKIIHQKNEEGEYTPNIESPFLYEQALLALVEVSLKPKIRRWEKAELYIFYVLKNIDSYSKSEMYNIMNSFKMLVKAVKWAEKSDKIDILLKEKLMEYGEGLEDVNYKIQIIEFLEDLKYIELAYDLAKKVQVNLPPESIKLEEIRKLVRRLHSTPIESKATSSVSFKDDDLDDGD